MSDQNFISGTVWTGDNLQIMRGINSNTVDLIYLDPPFNSDRNYNAPIGSDAEGAEFKDRWHYSDLKDEEWRDLKKRNRGLYEVIDAAKHTHGKNTQAYLVFMALRLIEMHRILRDTGSIYLHCDTTANSYLRLLLDCVFGKQNMRNEIVWSYSGGSSPRSHFPRKHDTIYFYTKSSDYRFNPQHEDYSDKSIARFNRTDESGRRYKCHMKNGKEIRSYMNEKGKIMPDVWSINIIVKSHSESTGYPTQKPVKLLERIILASSNKGDTVFDPFCGCATTLVAANRLDREWIGCDLSKLAVKLVNQRLRQDEGLLNKSLHNKCNSIKGLPSRTDTEDFITDFKKHKQTLYGEQGGYCKGCDTHFEPRNLEIDHIIPKVKGGTDARDNLQLLCGHCNRSKGDKEMNEWRAWLRQRDGD